MYRFKGKDIGLSCSVVGQILEKAFISTKKHTAHTVSLYSVTKHPQI